MAIAITLKSFLEEHDAHYEVVAHPRTTSALETCEAAHISGDQLVKSVLLGDDESYVMALLPASHRLDLDRINHLLGRELYLITEDEITGTFADCETGSLPPIGDAYGIETVLDLDLLKKQKIYFESGDHGLLIEMAGDEFKEILGDPTQYRISHHL
jgi:Ala-tRNA(Pro) deacylase